jgi:hypothetical protein
MVCRAEIGRRPGFLLVTAAWIALGIAGLTCKSPSPTAKRQVRVAAVTVSPSRASLAVGQKMRLSAILGDDAGNMLPIWKEPHDTTNGPIREAAPTVGSSMGLAGLSVTWDSSQSSVAKVDGHGTVTALSVGEITVFARSGGMRGSAKLTVAKPSITGIEVTPASATLSAGETIQLTLGPLGNRNGKPILYWSSSAPSCATINYDCVLTAKAAGSVTITATTGGQRGSATFTVVPATTIDGLDFPGNAGTETTMRFEFKSPMPAYPATYIWRVYPRQQQSYYTAFFWGNNGSFNGDKNYYGFHPYPDWKTPNMHFWEIAAPPGGDFLGSSHVTYDRWYIQAAVCKQTGNSCSQTFYWDWPNTDRVVQHNGTCYGNPPTPVLVVGDAPWNQGNEVWDGILRGFQFYDAALTLEQIDQEIASPGSTKSPWYLNTDPKPTDISDKSGNGHHPAWVGLERPSFWVRSLNAGRTIRTSITGQ